MPRRVRQAPLLDRIKASLDPYDFLLWIWEELNDDAYDEWIRLWATPIGLGLNFAFIVARGASRPASSDGMDDVFGDPDGKRGSGWVAWFATFLSHSLTILCCLNAYYTFSRKRHYRLFEQSVDVAPATPSAHRVRVDNAPVVSSPLRYLQKALASTRAGARAHADPEREVWELRVWDPKPICLTIFTLFSPGHLLLYYTLLPPATLDPRPSLTIVKAMFFGVVLSFQLGLLKTSFSQQGKDSALVQSQVMNEYDTKFVRPALNRVVRDVGIQTRESAISPRGHKTREVDLYVPTTIVKRAFTTNPNTNYARHYDPDNLSSTTTQSLSRKSSSGNIPQISETPSTFQTPAVSGYTNAETQSALSMYSTAAAEDFSSPIKPHHERLRERTPARGDGGSLGVFTHAASPLKRATGNAHLRAPLRTSTPGGTRASGSSYLDSGRRRETGRY